MANTIRASKNTFSGGLVMDLSPDNTPNEVLTSALNATLVTFNGNEMSLLNDMGNGRVETARLPDGYIPVGTCEFGDIIYIVSYNPLTNKSLIGCFPSPERNISSEEIGSTGQSLSCSDFLEGEIVNNLFVPNGRLKASSVKKIIYENKLNPGDKFIVYANNTLQNNNYITDVGNTSHVPGSFPKLIRIHVVAIEDSGKIVYLDSTLRWYNNNKDYFISECVNDNSSFKPDIDSYRNMLSSGYSVFLSKVSGKLALLIELEKIKGFSCTYNTYLSEEDNNGNKKCKVFWNINWDTDDVNINPSHIVLTESEMTGNIKSLAGKIGEYSYDLDSKEYKLNFNTDYSYPLPKKYDLENYWYLPIYSGYNPVADSTYNEFINGSGLGASYELHLNTFINTITLLLAYTGQTLTKINVQRSTNGGYKSIPVSGLSGYYYYINATSSGYNNNNNFVVYTQKSSDGSSTEILPVSIADDIVNNYFHSGVYKEFAEFTIPVKQIVNGNEFVPDISNLIYHYQITPAMPYGLLSEYAVDGYIDFSKIGSGKIDLTGWKYFNTENTSTLTMNLDAYVEENMGIAEVVLEFYDNQGFAAAYHIKDRESYSGQFTEYIPLNGYTLNYKLNSYNSNNEAKIHAGAEITSFDGIDLAIGLIPEGQLNEGTPIQIYIHNNKAYTTVTYNGGTPTYSNEYTGKIYYNDCGTLYGNVLYLVKIIIKYCPYNSIGELDTIDDSKFVTFHRWYWTNTMYNQYYYNTLDFDLLNFNLILDLLAKYSSTPYYKYGKFKYTNGYTDVIENSDNLYNALSANVLVVTALTTTDPTKNNNLLVQLEAGLLADYNTFSLRRSNPGSAAAYAETAVQVDVITNGDNYVENSPEIAEILHAGEGLMTSDSILPICNNAFDLSYIGDSLKNLLSDYFGTITNTDGEELWSNLESYLNYKNQFKLEFIGNTQSANTILDSQDLYLTYENNIADFNNKDCISILLKDIYDNNSLKMKADIIHYSKYLPLKRYTQGNFKKVVPIINTADDLESFGLSLQTGDANFVMGDIYVSYAFVMHWWNDQNGKREEHFHVYKYPVNTTNGHYCFWIGRTEWLDTWNRRPDFSIYRDGSREQFYNDKRTEWQDFIQGCPGFILTGFVPPVDSHGTGFYINMANSDVSDDSPLGTSFSRLFSPTSISSHINGHVNGHLGAWHGTPDDNRLLVNLSFLGDTRDSFHFLNNWMVMRRYYNDSLDNGFTNQIAYWGPDGSYYPPEIGNALASVLAGILTYSDSVSTNVAYDADVVYLSENYTTYTKDIVYKMYVNDGINHNTLINISGIAYDEYLLNVINHCPNVLLSDLSLNNINVNLLTIIKNCPLQLRINYVIPEFGMLGNTFISSIRVETIMRENFNVVGEALQGKLYYVKEEGGEKYLQPLDSGYIPKFYRKYLVVNGVLKANEHISYPKFLVPLPDLEKTFTYQDGAFKIKKDTVPASGLCHALATDEDGWMRIYDIYKKDMVFPYLNPFI